MNSISDIVRSSKFSYLCIFLVGLVLRGIPELLVSWYPIGYETITYYAPPMFTFGEFGLLSVFAEFFGSGPFFYVLMWFAKVVSGAHPYPILKAVGPLLYGGLAASFLLFLRRGLRLDRKTALVGALILVFQIAALRESWDRFRNVLALIFVFAALTGLKSDHKHKWWLVGLFSILAALSREYIALVLFISVLGFAVLQRRNRLVSLIALAPGLAMFSITVAIILSSWQSWWSYISNTQNAWSTHLWNVQDAFSIFIVCFLPLLPFVMKGFKRDELLDPMVAWLFVGSFSFIICPWFAVPRYQRWLMLLVFPFSIYTIKGFDHFHLLDKIKLRKLMAILLVFTVIGVGYSSGTFSYVRLTNSWVPTHLVQSSISWSEIDDVKGVLRWLDENAEPNSSILSEERFYGWTLIYLRRANEDVEVVPYGANSPPGVTLEKVLSNGFLWIYLIWYTDSNLESLHMVYSQNKVSVFQYGP